MSLDKEVNKSVLGELKVPLAASFVTALAQGIAEGCGFNIGLEVNFFMTSIPYVMNIDAVYGMLTEVEDVNYFEKGIEPPHKLNKLACSVGAGTTFYATSAFVGFGIGYAGSFLLRGL